MILGATKNIERVRIWVHITERPVDVETLEKKQNIVCWTDKKGNPALHRHCCWENGSSLKIRNRRNRRLTPVSCWHPPQQKITSHKIRRCPVCSTNRVSFSMNCWLQAQSSMHTPTFNNWSNWTDILLKKWKKPRRDTKKIHSMIVYHSAGRK